MDFEDFLPSYPDTEDPNLQQKLLNKKEFFDFRIQTLARQRDRTITREDLQSHQRIIQRFLSPHTPYDELLLYHETGTGKTRAAFAATEDILLAQTKSFRKVIFLARGTDQLNNALTELISYAQTTSRFADLRPDEDNPTASIQNQIKKALAGSYEFRTWLTFTRQRVAPFADAQVITEFDNTIFIVDEVHNIRNPSVVYEQLFRLFHLVPNRKILLMSGTPMRDQVAEIADLMNLILPLQQQLPIGDAFNQRFIDRQSNQIKLPNELKNYFKGRVSFLRTIPDTGVQRVYMGNFLNPALPIEQFKYFPTEMGEHQLKGYEQAWSLDTGSGVGIDTLDADRAANFYSNARQATLFVFPDGSYGRPGYERYVEKEQIEVFTKIVQPLSHLRKCSSKYAFIVEQLLRPETSNQLTYIYSSFVDGSGLELLARILEVYGFASCRGNESSPGRRYILLTSAPKQSNVLRATATKAQDINQLIRYFNEERNATGEYCRVILGSRIISEGFTFKNVRNVHILTLHWNYTETQQAIARAIRFGSHRSLLVNPSAIIPVNIYQHVCFANNAPTIDLQMLEVAQQKDILVRRATRLIKEISFDCPLVFERNYADTDVTNSRDCDYSRSCEYKCSQTNSPNYDPLPVDLNTFRLYYQENTDLDVWNAVRQYFQRSTGLPVDLHTLENELEIDWFQLVRVLATMVRFNTPLLNAYGVECFLREDRNFYYLVDNLLLPNNDLHLAWYTRHPTILQTIPLRTLIQQKGIPIYANRIDELRGQYSQAVLQSLPASLRELYKSFQQEQVQTGVLSLEAVLQSARDRGAAFYGTIDQNDQFRIVDNRDVGELTDVRKRKTGARCLEVGFNIDRLVQVYFALGVDVPIPDEYLTDIPDPAAKLAGMKKYGPALLVDPALNLSALDPESYRQALYRIIRMLGMSKADLCSTLREWMRDNQLLALIVSKSKGVKKK